MMAGRARKNQLGLGGANNMVVELGGCRPT